MIDTAVVTKARMKYVDPGIRAAFTKSSTVSGTVSARVEKQ
jgi:hypothetical protein